MKTINMCILGDLLINDTFMKNFNKARNKINKIYSFFNKSDIIVLNLEGPITERCVCEGKKCCIKNENAAVWIMKKLGVNAVSLANNHIFDYGLDGFLDTKEILEREGISYFGAGENILLATTPKIIIKNGIKLGFLGYCWDGTGSKSAGKNSYGVAPMKKDIIIEDVKKLKNKCDAIIVSLHWGFEREKYAPPSYIKLARDIIDAGATVIMGHHSHVTQQIESYKKGLIIYSLGNFIFPDIVNKKYKIIQKKENKEGVLVNLSIDKNGLRAYSTNDFILDNFFVPVIDETNTIKKYILEDIDYNHRWKKIRIRKDLPDPTRVTVNTIKANKLLLRTYNRLKREIIFILYGVI